MRRERRRPLKSELLYEPEQSNSNDRVRSSEVCVSSPPVISCSEQWSVEAEGT